jgi:hypothetical protein
MRLAWALAASLLISGAALAHGAPRPRAAEGRSAADAVYQKGVQLYAQGRFPEALVLFVRAQRLDPSNRAARVAADRVRTEIAMSASAGARTAPPIPGYSPLETEDDESFLSDVVRFVNFDEAVGEDCDREGRARAMQGKIAQLLAEKKVALSLGRSFSKDAELHALSRRLS